MAWLSGRDLGVSQVKAESGLFTGDIPADEGAYNPSTNDGVANLKAFRLSHELGKAVDDRDSIAGETARLAVGAKSAVPITLRARFQKKIPGDRSKLDGYVTATDAASLKAALLQDEMEALKFLSIWAANRTIIMLFYKPRDNEKVYFGQPVDFYESDVKILYDVLWDQNQSSSTQGFPTDVSETYGTIHYEVTLNSHATLATYEACAIPVIFTNINIDDQPDTEFMDVDVEGFALKNELII